MLLSDVGLNHIYDNILRDAQIVVLTLDILSVNLMEVFKVPRNT